MADVFATVRGTLPEFKTWASAEGARGAIAPLGNVELEKFRELFATANEIATHVDIVLSTPRQTVRMTQRANMPSQSAEENSSILRFTANIIERKV